MERIEVYAVGLVSASACAAKDATRDEIEREVNVQAPTGISSRWSVSEDQRFATGEPMPCPCNKQPEERLHYLLHC